MGNHCCIASSPSESNENNYEINSVNWFFTTVCFLSFEIYPVVHSWMCLFVLLSKCTSVLLRLRVQEKIERRFLKSKRSPIFGVNILTFHFKEICNRRNHSGGQIYFHFIKQVPNEIAVSRLDNNAVFLLGFPWYLSFDRCSCWTKLFFFKLLSDPNRKYWINRTSHYRFYRQKQKPRKKQNNKN